jgi:hypothetical protein
MVAAILCRVFQGALAHCIPVNTSPHQTAWCRRDAGIPGVKLIFLQLPVKNLHGYVAGRAAAFAAVAAYVAGNLHPQRRSPGSFGKRWKLAEILQRAGDNNQNA